MACGLDEYGVSVLTVFLILIPTAFYILGALEGRLGRYLFSAGLVIHGLSILHRGLLTGRLPLSEKHDNISFMAFSMALMYLYLIRKKDARDFSVIVPPLISVFMFISIGFSPADSISPFLNTPWFYLHSFLYFLSYAFFGISASTGVLYILKGGPDYEQLQYKSAACGWIILSLSLFAGSVWFYIAYGTYWLWTSKELWITITWLYYGLYLHARLMRGLKGKPASVIGALGFAVALFTYFGVGTVIKSPPTQF